MPKKSKKRKGKKGKKGKKPAIIPDPLPLHSLTDIYKKIDELVRQLINARMVARNKRKEAELFQNEMESLKRDDAVYKEHLQDLLTEIKDSLLDFQTRLEKERESIKKEIAKILAQLDKKLETTHSLIEESERKIEELRKGLKELQQLMNLVAQLLEQLTNLKLELEKLSIEVAIKTRHLQNQYLVLRSDLFNYLQEQLEILITKIRGYLMPICWEHMYRLEMQNRCHRWELLKKDEKNFKLHVVRENLAKQLEKLDGEEPYYGCDWVFERLNEQRELLHQDRRRWKKRLQEVFKNRNLTQHYKKKVITIVEKPPSKVETDFREYLKHRLQAIEAAKHRQLQFERRHEMILKKADIKQKQHQEAAKRRAIFHTSHKSLDKEGKERKSAEPESGTKIEPAENEVEIEGKNKNDNELGGADSSASIKSKHSGSKINLKEGSSESSLTFPSVTQEEYNVGRRSVAITEEEDDEEDERFE